MKDNKKLFKEHLDLVMLKVNDKGDIEHDEVADLMTSLELKDTHDVEHGVISVKDVNNVEYVDKRVFEVINIFHEYGFCDAVVDNNTKVVALMTNHDDRICFRNTATHRRIAILNQES